MLNERVLARNGSLHGKGGSQLPLSCGVPEPPKRPIQNRRFGPSSRWPC